MRMVWSCLAVAACSYSPSAIPGNSDGAVDGPPCELVWPYTPSNLGSCGQPTGAFDIDNGDFEYNPDGGILEQVPGQIIGTFPTTGAPTHVLVVTGFHVGPNATLRFTGSGPLIIAVDGSATIEGTITVAATATTSGAGGGTCAGDPGDDASGTPPKSAGGGGAGGGFGSIGAAGGNGDVKAGFPLTAGGDASPVRGDETLIPLRAGCRGGGGGKAHPTAMANPGVGGGGGGAFQISVRDQLSVLGNARLQAGGGGGGGVDNIATGAGTHVGAGGGGGGSGGAIFLEAATFVLDSTVFLCANGGGGGAGSHEATENQPGADAACADVRAMGGLGDNNAGRGGDGAFTGAASPGTSGAGEDGGGGGGGGGAGRIRVHVIGAKPASVPSSPTAVID